MHFPHLQHIVAHSSPPNHSLPSSSVFFFRYNSQTIRQPHHEPNPSQPTNLARRPKTFGPKTGNRVIAPKRASLISANGIKKSRSAGLSSKTEAMLGQKAGHLELLKGGKRDKKAALEKERIAKEGKKELRTTGGDGMRVKGKC
jgi:hypothetical protein